MALKGEKRAGSITSWERGKNVAVICTICATGDFVPPMFIFPRQRMLPQLAKDEPAGAIYLALKMGGPTANFF